MAKKKTRVLLPGGIQALVHDLQNGGSQYAQINLDDMKTGAEKDDDERDAQDAGNQEVGGAATNSGNVAAEPLGQSPQTAVAQRDGVGEEPAADARPALAENGAQASDAAPRPENANGESLGASVAGQGDAGGAGSANDGATASKPQGDDLKEYHIVKDDSRDSWELFLDMAKQYKHGDGKLATIYIDGTLKNVLDRMKYAGTEKLTTSAILSSIVARFVYDHEEDIRKVLFSGRLL